MDNFEEQVVLRIEKFKNPYLKTYIRNKNNIRTQILSGSKYTIHQILDPGIQAKIYKENRFWLRRNSDEIIAIEILLNFWDRVAVQWSKYAYPGFSDFKIIGTDIIIELQDNSHYSIEAQVGDEAKRRWAKEKGYLLLEVWTFEELIELCKKYSK